MFRTATIIRIAATAGVLALLPASASAGTTWFGSSLNHEPANAGSTCLEDPSDETIPAPMCTRVGSNYPGFSGRATSPKKGKVVRVKVYAQGPMTFRFQIVRTRNLTENRKSGSAKLYVNGPVLHAVGEMDADGAYKVETFKVNLPVRKGDSLAIATTENTAEYCSNGTPGMLTFVPQLKRNEAFRTSNDYVGCLLLVQAVVKTG
jgi:hypothetical protein